MAELPPIEPALFMLPAPAFLLLAALVAEPESSGEVPAGFFMPALFPEWFIPLREPAMPFLSMPAALPEASGEPCTPEPVMAEPLAPMVPDEVVPLSMPMAPLGVMPAPEPEASAEP